MELISSKESLDFLSKSAPRPWIKRMLLWMIYSGELDSYFQAGRIVPRTYVGYAEFANKIIHKADTDYIDGEAVEWGPNAPEHVAPGYFVYASYIDWEKGTLEATIYRTVHLDEHLFWDADTNLVSEFQHADYFITLAGLCFKPSQIELLQPNAELTTEKILPTDGRSRTGRPRLWGWESATMHLLAMAQHPDGLPTGPGGQAQIERAVADWFMKTSGNTPAPSQIRQHVAKIMGVIKKSESP